MLRIGLWKKPKCVLDISAPPHKTKTIYIAEIIFYGSRLEKPIPIPLLQPTKYFIDRSVKGSIKCENHCRKKSKERKLWKSVSIITTYLLKELSLYVSAI